MRSQQRGVSPPSHSRAVGHLWVLGLLASALLVAACSTSSGRPTSIADGEASTTATSSAPTTLSGSSTTTTQSTTSTSMLDTYGSVPTSIESTIPSDPACASNMAAYGISLQPVATVSQTTSSAVSSGSAAVDNDLTTILPDQLSSASTIRAYPALVTKQGGGVNPGLGVSSLIDRPMWVVEITGVAVAALHPLQQASTSSIAPYTIAVDFIDVQTGLTGFTTFC